VVWAVDAPELVSRTRLASKRRKLGRSPAEHLATTCKRPANIFRYFCIRLSSRAFRILRVDPWSAYRNRSQSSPSVREGSSAPRRMPPPVARRRTQLFLKESVILFGFLNGVFFSLGVNPGQTLFAVAAEILDTLTGGNGGVRLALTLAPLALLGFALYLIHKRAGWLGFVAVGAAFLSGLWLLSEPMTAFILILTAVGIGLVATR
jgi:hypothetical protein